MFYQEGSSLDLDLIVQAYEADRERVWGGDEQTRKFLALVDHLAGTLLRGSQELVVPLDSEHPFSWDQVRFLTQQESISDRVLERLEIDIAWAFCTETRAMARRCLELATLVLSARPNPIVLRFLKRLSRCYIAGFFPECVMLCRSVFENAMKENIGAAIAMKKRIEVARERGLLSERGRESALLIWDRGNEAVHEGAESTEVALETVRLTAQVLAELYSPRSDAM